MSDDVTTVEPGEKTPGRLGRIYQGRTTVDFVGRKRTWFSISLVIIVLGLASLGIRGFNLGIDFKGGSSWEVQSTALVGRRRSRPRRRRPACGDPIVEKLGSKTYQVTADINNLSGDAQTKLINKVANALAKTAHTNTNQRVDRERGADVGRADHAPGARGVDRLLHRGRRRTSASGSNPRWRWRRSSPWCTTCS